MASDHHPTANDAFFMSDAKGQFLEVNDAFCRMTGRRQKELLQLGIGEVFDSPKEVEDKLLKIFIAGTGTFNCGIHSQNGALIHLEVSANYLPSDGGPYVPFLRDITERKEMQEVLSAEKERLAVTLRSIGDGVIATDTNGQTILMNSVALRDAQGDVRPFRQDAGVGGGVLQDGQCLSEHYAACSGRNT